MIKLQDYTPEVYYRESRDFQFIGRLYDLVLNYVKTNADLIYSLPLSDNSDNQFIDLMAMTLGFHAKHKYTSQQLKAICFVLSEIIRNKGTIKALTIACDAIFHAEGIQGQFDYGLTNNNTNIIIYLPQELSDTTLLNDLFEYILPAGMSCQIIKTYSEKALPTTEVGVESTFSQYNGDPAQNRDIEQGRYYQSIDRNSERERRQRSVEQRPSWKNRQYERLHTRSKKQRRRIKWRQRKRQKSNRSLTKICMHSASRT